MYENSIYLAGNLGATPEVKTANSGSPWCQFSVAVNEKVGDKNVTHWLPCIAFKSAAERLRNLPKGTNVMIRGKLEESTWTDKTTGENRHAIKVIVLRIAILSQQAHPQEEKHESSTPTLASFDETIPF